MRRTTDAALAQRVEFDVVEKVRTIRGAIASLQRARDNGSPQASIQFLVSELAGHCDQVQILVTREAKAKLSGSFGEAPPAARARAREFDGWNSRRSSD